jgi:hypothetical protein
VTKSQTLARTTSAADAAAATVILIMPHGAAAAEGPVAGRGGDVNTALASTLEQVARELRASGAGGSAFAAGSAAPTFAAAMRQVEAEVYGPD